MSGINLSATVVVKRNNAQKRIRGVKSKVDESTWHAVQTGLEEMHARAPKGAEPKPGEVSIDASLQIKGSQGDATLEVGSIGAHKSRPVARFNEFGTGRQKPHPFERPAAARMRKQLKEEAAAKVRQEINSDG